MITELEARVLRFALEKGFTNREIAAALDTTEIAVASSINRARQRNKIAFGRGGYAELMKELKKYDRQASRV